MNTSPGAAVRPVRSSECLEEMPEQWLFGTLKGEIVNGRTKLSLAVLTTAALATTGTATPAFAHGPGHDHGTGTGTATGTATAQHRTTIAVTQLGTLNRSGARGAATVRLHGRTAHVTVVVTGLLANAPHAMHIHAGAQGRCPTGRADTNRDGVVSVTEGHPFYGHVAASLTTRGDTGPASALAVDRFPTAPHRTVVYQRRITVSAATATAVRHRNAVIVVHGVDSNRSGGYDGALRSDLDPALPMEATAPAACGPLRPLI